ncbi:MAG: tetratricopeptide repeat protein [Trichodesmium sp. MAG_R04]|nr:tetratricopeptide repeat protein [Trichodesmium sp. MAG_R04]
MEISLNSAWSLYENCKWEVAQRKFQEAIDKQPQITEDHLGLGMVLRDLGKVDKAIESFERAIALKPNWLLVYSYLADAQQKNQDNTITRLIEVLIEQGRLSRELISQGLLSKAIFKAHQSHKAELLKNCLEKKLLGIILPTQKKSGTQYIIHNLAKGLGVSFSWADVDSLSFLQFGNILKSEIKEQVLRGNVVGSHIQPNRFNLLLLNLYVERLIVNVRDPRPATLSLLHHLNKHYRSFPYYYILHIKNGSIVKNYLELDFKAQVDYMIETKIPYFVKWICGWLEAKVSLEFYPIIMFTRHEDLAKDSNTFFKSILDFYEIDFSLFTMPQPPELGKSNFRKGSVNEWREVFTLEQREKATSLIPQDLFDRFEWVK